MICLDVIFERVIQLKECDEMMGEDERKTNRDDVGMKLNKSNDGFGNFPSLVFIHENEILVNKFQTRDTTREVALKIRS